MTAISFALADLRDGAARGFPREGRAAVFVVRRSDALHAFVDRCPHVGRTSLAWRRDEYLSPDAAHIRCAAHGALFEIATGLCIAGPCCGDRLTALPVAVANGVVTIVTGEPGEARKDPT